MLFYSAGNFVLLSNSEKEQSFKELSERVYGEGSYNRLTSFFYLKETVNVLEVKGQSDGTDKKKRSKKINGGKRRRISIRSID